MRTTCKNNFDNIYKFRNDEFKVGDMILIFDFITVINILAFKKLNYRWIGLYRITKSDFFKEIYKVSELDGAVFRDTYVNNRLKRFYAVVVPDVSNRYKASASSGDGDNNIINFADAF